MRRVFLFLILCSFISGNSQDLIISNLTTSSGKIFKIKYDGFNIDSLQYVDREYIFKIIPDSLKGKTLIMTAGNDKMYTEDEVCFSFDVNCDVNIYVLYGVKYPRVPDWLLSYKKTTFIVSRHDSSNETLKGIFNVYEKSFSKGKISINGCMLKELKTPEFIKSGGSGYCMYSIVVSKK
jgi:hypothetical protein